MADPGLAAEVTQRVAEDLASRLHEDTEQQWNVETMAQELPLGPDGNVNLPIMGPRSFRSKSGITSFISPSYRRFMISSRCCVERSPNPAGP